MSQVNLTMVPLLNSNMGYIFAILIQLMSCSSSTDLMVIDNQEKADEFIRPENYGAKADGVTCDELAFEMAITAALATSTPFATRQVKYKLCSSITIPDSGDEPLVWRGNNAVLNNTVIVAKPATTISNVIIRNSPSDGFVFRRGQAGSFTNLTAESCTGNGFVLGGHEGAQVAWSNFTNCLSRKNANGFILDGTFSKNWVNANVLSGCWARQNRGGGFKLEGVTNYNTFMGCHAEGNDTDAKGVSPLMIISGGDNVFTGGHYVASDKEPTYAVVDNGRKNVYLGGRYVSSDLTLSSAAKKRDPGMDSSRKVTFDKKARRVRTLPDDVVKPN